MKNFRIFLCLLLLSVGLSGCKSDEQIPQGAEPRIESILSTFTPDMNTGDNIPVVCVVFSEVGLSSVEVYINRAGSETLLRTITSFNDPTQYSVRETPAWDESITSVRIAATDRARKTVSKSIPVSVIPYMSAPVITFDPAEIVIDENTGVIDIPTTRFTIEGSSTLSAVEVSLFRKATTETITLTPALTQGSMTYSFEQDILYADGDVALQVKATDTYGKVKIETLPITYIAIPAPVIVPTGTTTLDPIVAASGTTASPTFRVTSAIGVNSIRVYKVEKGVETELAGVGRNYDAQTDIAFTAALPAFEASWNAIKLVAVDRLGRQTSQVISTIIDLRYKPSLRIGTQYYSKVSDPDYPGTFCFFSVRDMQTYPLVDFYNDTRNIDMYFYFFNSAVRLYAATVNRPGEAWSADADNNVPFLENWPAATHPRNGTKIKKFIPASWSFTFDNVTSADLQTPAVQTYLNQGQVTDDFANYAKGEVAFFQTVAASTAPSKIGIMRIENFVLENSGQFSNTKGYYIVSFKILN